MKKILFSVSGLLLAHTCLASVSPSHVAIFCPEKIQCDGTTLANCKQIQGSSGWTLGINFNEKVQKTTYVFNNASFNPSGAPEPNTPFCSYFSNYKGHGLWLWAVYTGPLPLTPDCKFPGNAWKPGEMWPKGYDCFKLDLTYTNCPFTIKDKATQGCK